MTPFDLFKRLRRAPQVDRLDREDYARSLNATVPLKTRLRAMRGLRKDRTASTVIRGHAFVQNLRRGHSELGVEMRHERLRVAAAFDGLTATI